VQVDATFDAFINYDYAWDGVWQGAARVDSTGWSAEYRIPFSQLAYAARPGDSLPFGLNVYRLAMRLGESSNWSPRLPIYADLESHFNTISGLTAPESPERLEIVPYTAVKGSFTPAEGNPLIDPQQGDGFAGADLRLRIGRGFSATAAIHPDFGQVEADPSQINLTTFETYFTEQRPFFVEGASQFAFDLSLPFATRGNSFTNEQPFYSRRIGGAPQGAVPPDAQYSDIATSTTLLGAAKLSGRTTNGWSAGAMAAVTAGSEAQYIDALGGTQSAVVEPATLFDVVRLSRASHDGGSAIGLIGTGVFRPGMDSAMADQRLSRAFTLGVDGRHRFGAGDYEVSGFLAGSRIAGSENAVTGILNGPGHYFQRPDAPYLHGDKPRTAIGGLAAQARIAKIGGSWHWAAIGHLVTPGFEINDVGFQRNADWLLAMGSFGYQAISSGAGRQELTRSGRGGISPASGAPRWPAGTLTPRSGTTGAGHSAWGTSFRRWPPTYCGAVQPCCCPHRLLSRVQLPVTAGNRSSSPSRERLPPNRGPAVTRGMSRPASPGEPPTGWRWR
jgi:hypothetical protein